MNTIPCLCFLNPFTPNVTIKTKTQKHIHLNIFIIVYYMFNGDAGAAGVWPTLHGSVGALVTTFLVIPLVARISKTMGKKKTFLLSQGISIIGYLLFWFLFVHF